LIVSKRNERDFLDELIEERTERSPAFPSLLAAAEERRKMARALAAMREERHLSQTVVAARMQSAQSVVSNLEAGEDVRVSTIQKYLYALGRPTPTAAQLLSMLAPAKTTTRKR
jgi:hypothetical protein